jgi:hypothetical protein
MQVFDIREAISYSSLIFVKMDLSIYFIQTNSCTLFLKHIHI